MRVQRVRILMRWVPREKVAKHKREQRGAHNKQIIERLEGTQPIAPPRGGAWRGGAGRNRGSRSSRQTSRVDDDNDVPSLWPEGSAANANLHLFKQHSNNNQNGAGW